jgi:hypothetical protein
VGLTGQGDPLLLRLEGDQAAKAATAMITPTVCASHAGVDWLACDRTHGDRASQTPNARLRTSFHCVVSFRSTSSLLPSVAATIRCHITMMAKTKATLSAKAVMPNALAKPNPCIMLRLRRAGWAPPPVGGARTRQLVRLSSLRCDVQPAACPPAWAGGWSARPCRTWRPPSRP